VLATPSTAAHIVISTTGRRTRLVLPVFVSTRNVGA
jgi:hypothetical protein